MFRDYSPLGVQFYYIYKTLAHPELDGYIQPFSLEERLMHVQEAQRVLGSDIPWLCDAMSNEVTHAMGDAPNSEFILDPDGIVVRRRGWSDPMVLRRDLEELVGPVERQTRIADLDMKRIYDEKPAASGVVPRIELPSRTTPMRTEPIENDVPFYVKLRAESETSLYRDGEGYLYLGFHLDPLYHVHWNNLVDPVEYLIDAPDGYEVSPVTGKGPIPEAKADIDPREFLVHIKHDARIKKPLKVTVRYFACNDAEGWCIPVTQEYLVYLERDPDAGTNQLRNTGPGGAIGRGADRERGNRGNRVNVQQMMDRYDADGDGKITLKELPERIRDRFLKRFDRNGDGVVTKLEITRSRSRPRPD